MRLGNTSGIHVDNRLVCDIASCAANPFGLVSAGRLYDFQIEGDGLMATPGPSESSTKDAPGISGLDESHLEKSILRRGLATAAEIEACKNHRKQQATTDKEASKSLLEVMVEAKVLTKSQMMRLMQEVGEVQRTLKIPGYQMLPKLGKGSMGIGLQGQATQR